MVCLGTYRTEHTIDFFDSVRRNDVGLCWDLRSTSKDFSQHASSFVRSTTVCSATFRRDLLLQLPNPYHIISAVTALQAAAQLEVACLIFCVLRDEHLSIDRSILSIFSPRLLLLASSAILLPLL